MIQKNYDYLTETLLPKFGFPNVFNEAIKPDMEAGVEKIMKMASEVIDKKNFSYEITLDRRPNDMYYLNAIKASITDEKGVSVSQDFRLGNQNGFNRQEMDNLLQGRSVYRTYVDKNNQRQSNWTWIDLSKQKEDGNFPMRTRNDRNHEFRLIKELGKLNPPMMTAEQKEDLMFSIMKGNRTPIFLNQGAERVRLFVEVDARKLALNVFDSKGKIVEMLKEKSNLTVAAPPKLSAAALKALAKSNGQGEGQSKQKVG